MVTWGPELSVGWEEIDAQHREILVRVGDLHDRVEQGDEFAAQAALDALTDTVVLHFATEQDLMDRSGYPEKEAHGRAHELFLQDLHALSDELDALGLSQRVIDWVSARMTEWILFHIQANDLPLGRHLARLRQRRGNATSAGKAHRS